MVCASKPAPESDMEKMFIRTMLEVLTVRKPFLNEIRRCKYKGAKDLYEAQRNEMVIYYELTQRRIQPSIANLITRYFIRGAMGKTQVEHNIITACEHVYKMIE
jgi:hypothetical protein